MARKEGGNGGWWFEKDGAFIGGERGRAGGWRAPSPVSSPIRKIMMDLCRLIPLEERTVWGLIRVGGATQTRTSSARTRNTVGERLFLDTYIVHEYIIRGHIIRAGSMISTSVNWDDMNHVSILNIRWRARNTRAWFDATHEDLPTNPTNRFEGGVNLNSDNPC